VEGVALHLTPSPRVIDAVGRVATLLTRPGPRPAFTRTTGLGRLADGRWSAQRGSHRQL